MSKRIIPSSFAILVLLATLLVSASGQDTTGLGQAEYVDEYDAIVVGQTDFFPSQPVTYLVTLTDEFGNVTNGIADVAEDGSFVLVSSKEMIKGPLSFVEGAFFEQSTGDHVSDFEIAVLTDFEKWFKKWRKKLNGITDPPTGRPCLYKHSHLGDNYEDIDMETGDYFPHWDPYGEFDDHNKPFIEALVAEGEPVRDTFLKPDGTLNPATGTLKQERDILIAGGYEFNVTDGQWEK